ncbi:MAG TPA: carbamoyl phosphate synthase small subunit [Alcanivoracaceae bacterium]|nr:carbamoyl phosphate synthase small subunit [Alcanivoracaceae bacterium]
MTDPALLALEDGSVFRGVSIGAPGQVSADVVFSTAASGYQELLTDPALAGRILTLTYPIAGSTGVNAEDAEADGVAAAGLIVRELSQVVSNWRAEQSLSEYLQQHGVVGIAEIDTRRLTRLLREHGTLRGCIQCGDNIDEAAAIAAAKNAAPAHTWPSTTTSYGWQEGIWQWGEGFSKGTGKGPKVAVLDLGVTRTLLRVLVEAGAQVTVLPADTKAEAIDADAVVLSNGPGAADANENVVATAKALLAAKKPVFGVGLGMRVMAVAEGAKEVALVPGHFGGSHPVRCLATGKVEHADQRSANGIDADSLPAHITVTHQSLFDSSVQGLQWQGTTALGFQGAPKGSVGSVSADALMADFVASLTA